MFLHTQIVKLKLTKIGENKQKEVGTMVLKKDKENKITVRPQERKGELTTRRPTDLWSEMDQIFDNFRSSFDDLFWPLGYKQHSMPMIQRRTPPMDIADMGDRYEMRLEMPGIPKDNVDIEVTPNGVEISAQYNETKEETDKQWLRRERSSMNFYRSFEVPEELKTDNVNAELKDGVLTLKLPKMEPKPEYKPKKIPVK